MKNDLLEYELVVPKTIEKYLFKLYKKDKKTFNILNRELIEIANRPHDYPMLRGNFTGCHKARKSNHRIIFEINEKEKKIIILRVGKRSSAYKFLALFEISE
ncbi:MAG: type II toxin-antitoxin system RelE/ParE family toxin [Methanobacteriaceae archaeon]|nr:type II toxin-antitoxin system RelE/ParE family toxin [Candidatus Methanorudis spinitermitis]